MRHSKGSFSLIYLAAILYLTLFAQLLLYHLQNDYERSSAYAQDLQQRMLCSSLFNWLTANMPSEGSCKFAYTYPSAKQALTVEGTHAFSSDSVFDHYSAKVTLGNSKQTLHRLGFYPSQTLKVLGEQHMFISKYAPTGTEYLADDSLYTSKGSFTMPAISFLSNKASLYLEMSSVHENGFSNTFTYLKQATALTYLAAVPTTKGKALLACTRGITLRKNFRAPDRMILISNESITLEDNVDLGSALIIAKGNVTIGSNCKIRGVVFSSSTIKFKGKGTFIHDTSVVADYVSALFIA